MQAIMPISVNYSTTGWVQKKLSRHARLWTIHRLAVQSSDLISSKEHLLLCK